MEYKEYSDEVSKNVKKNLDGMQFIRSKKLASQYKKSEEQVEFFANKYKPTTILDVRNKAKTTIGK